MKETPVYVKMGGEKYLFSQKDCEKALFRAKVVEAVRYAVMNGGTVSRAIYDASVAYGMSPQTAWTHWRVFRYAKNAKITE